MSSKLTFHKSPDYGTCPSCNAADSLKRSHSRSLPERLVNHLTFYRTYRCRDCGWRGFMSTLTLSSKSLKSLLFYLLMGLLCAAVTRIVLTKYF